MRIVIYAHLAAVAFCLCFSLADRGLFVSHAASVVVLRLVPFIFPLALLAWLACPIAALGRKPPRSFVGRSLPKWHCGVLNGLFCCQRSNDTVVSAAERRQSVAPGVSRGDGVYCDPQPRRGGRSPRLRISVAPPGLCVSTRDNPQADAWGYDLLPLRGWESQTVGSVTVA
jgi:hypothetical protein